MQSDVLHATDLLLIFNCAVQRLYILQEQLRNGTHHQEDSCMNQEEDDIAAAVEEM